MVDLDYTNDSVERSSASAGYVPMGHLLGAKHLVAQALEIPGDEFFHHKSSRPASTTVKGRYDK